MLLALILERAAFTSEKTAEAAQKKIAPIDKGGFALVACLAVECRKRASATLEDAVEKFIEAATYADDKALRKAVKNASHKATAEALDASVEEFIKLAFAMYKQIEKE